MSRHTEKGFTLVELSIVLVIIGLIVAGVVAGQSLVKQAQLRSIISEQEGIRVAINGFKLQYDAVPGDFATAGSYWSALALNCSYAGTGGVYVQAECNGDGNKRILMDTGANAGEAYMAWKHLSLAGLYSGSFIPGTTVVGAIGTNIPASKFSGAGITLMYDDSAAAATSATAGDNAAGGRNVQKNVILFGGVTAGIPNGTVFSANQTSGIDIKADDGNPLKGTVIAVGVSGAAATNCVVAATSIYKLDSTDTAPCAIAFGL